MGKKDNIATIASFLVFAFFVFIRFYQVALRFSFDIDTQYQALLASTIVKDFHIIWIGVSASNIGYYLGPGLVYLTAFLLWITKDPVILGYFASFVGSISLLSVWYVASRLYNKNVALIAAVLYGSSSFIIAYDRKFWPIFVPLVGVWMLFGLVQSQKNKWWLFLCVFLISASFHIHLSLMLFWPFIIYAFYRSKTYILNRSNIIFIIINFALYLLITSPLLIFDIVHNFDNLKMPLRLFQSILSGKSAITRSLPWMYICFLFAGMILWIKTKSGSEKIIYAIFSFISLAFIFYPGPMQEYYTVILFPFITIGGAIAIHKLPKILLLTGLFCFICINIYKYSIQPTTQGLTSKKIAVENICRELKNSQYYLEVGESGRDYGGWYYLFTAYCRQPSRSDSDEMFGWIYQKELETAPPIEQLIKVKKPF